MMSLQAIRDLAAQAADEAARSNLMPRTFWDNELEHDRSRIDDGYLPRYIRSIPNLGSYRPDGWELVDNWLVDKTGFGYDDEPALTLSQFAAKMDAEHGYAIIEEGQFQIVVGVFTREGS